MPNHNTKYNILVPESCEEVYGIFDAIIPNAFFRTAHHGARCAVQNYQR